MNISPTNHLRVTPSFDIPGVLSLTASNQYWLGMTMFRMQEFYESHHEFLRGQVFSLETAMDIYADTDGIFAYAHDWAGFNVPGNICDQFFTRYHGLLSSKESYLLELIQRYRPKNGDQFYLIGTCEQNGIGFMNHELAHAAWYLDPVYRKTMRGLIDKLSTRTIKKIAEWLGNQGYHRDVFDDEIQAYLSTNDSKETRENFKINPICSKPFREFHTDYFERRLLDRGRVQI